MHLACEHILHAWHCSTARAGGVAHHATSISVAAKQVPRSRAGDCVVANVRCEVDFACSAFSQDHTDSATSSS
jgi:hypothetical protein